MTNTIDIGSDELSKLFYLADEWHGRAVPMLSVYDPEYDGAHVPDWANNPDWFIPIVQNGEVNWVKGYPTESQYFGKEAASEQDNRGARGWWQEFATIFVCQHRSEWQ